MFMNVKIYRLFHHSAGLLSSKNLLSKLRKKTGFSFVNCKKALQLHNNDIQKAEEWLRAEAQKQGWDKATKLEGRPTIQGLIGILSGKHAAAIVEVNCETDFVARNTKFQDLAAKITHCCYNHTNVHEPHVNQLVKKWDAKTDELKKFPWQEDKTIADLIALNIGFLGENMSICRSAFLKARESHPNVHFGYYAHGETGSKDSLPYGVNIGKYGAIVAFRKLAKPDKLPGGRTIEELGRQLSQHIVGMNPRAIGDAKRDEPNEDRDEESLMIFQEFLLDPDLTVSELLQQNGVEIIDYVRYECGETAADANQ